MSQRTITGGGAFLNGNSDDLTPVLAWYNGTEWTVCGK